MRSLLSVFILCVLVACSKKEPEQLTSNLFQPAQRLAHLSNKELSEVSGVAASANNAGLLWMLNDSDNGPKIFLVNDKLDIMLTCTLEGVKNRDWEDLAIGRGPDPNKNYVYVGEIGDNRAAYDYKNIYRFEEPVLLNGSKTLAIEKFDTITFALSDGKKDTESLMLDPKTKNLYVISKRENPVYVYELKYPQSTHDTIIAEKLISLPLSQAVAAGFSENGNELLVKNYKNVYYWNIGNRKLADALKDEPLVVQYKEEPQGESITFSRDGKGFYTISEKVKGEESYLYYYPRK